MSSGEDADSSRDSSDVVVPMRVYKTVTVFSTLFAVIGVVGGFIVLDVATNRAQAEFAEIDPLLALIGVGLIAVSAVVYAFSTRFRAEGMGNDKESGDEETTNGR